MSERFGSLLSGAITSIAKYEKKSVSEVEREIGEDVNLGEDAIRRYKSGHIPPENTTIEVLAKIGIKKAFLNREWLLNFLSAAQYPTPEKLIAQLIPGTKISPTRIYQNLPGATYGRFVMRQQAYEEILEGLTRRSAVVLVASLGGMGKTSLIREIASHALNGSDPFAAVVWVSDKDHPGTTNLSVVLDEIAHTLDYPTFTQYEFSKKQREVEQLLRSYKTLLVVDNFETIKDDSLLQWLVRLPEPSKTIITTREARREFLGSWLVTLSGMTEDEAIELINQQLTFLRLSGFITDKTSALIQFRPLIEVAGGNPKALTLALGSIKYGQTLDEVVQSIRAAKGEIFSDLFRQAWLKLNDSARRVLLSLTLFAGSTTASHLSATANIEGGLFEPALEFLTNLALVDVQHTGLNIEQRYLLHPLVRSFAESKLPDYPDFVTRSLPRLANNYLEMAQKLGDYRGRLENLENIDSEQETIYRLIETSLKAGLHSVVCKLTRSYFYYYYACSHWQKVVAILQWAEQAAQTLGDKEQQAWAKNKTVQLRIKKGELEQASFAIDDIEQISQWETDSNFSVASRIDFQHTLGLYWLELAQPAKAADYWRKSLQFDLEQLPWEAATSRRWLGNALYDVGAFDEARPYLEQAVAIGSAHSYSRIVIGAQLKLSELALRQNNLPDAQINLEKALDLLAGNNDHRNNGRVREIQGQLHFAKGQTELAKTAFRQAQEHYARVGMQSELANLRQKLTELENPSEREQLFADDSQPAS